MDGANHARGEALRRLREGKAWTQAHLAAVAGVSPRTVMRVEGTGEASAETLLSLCSALGIAPGDLPSLQASPREEAAHHPIQVDDEEPPEAGQAPVPEAREPATHQAWRHGRAPRQAAHLLGALALGCCCYVVYSFLWATVILTAGAANLPFNDHQDPVIARNLAKGLNGIGEAVAVGKAVTDPERNPFTNPGAFVGMRVVSGCLLTSVRDLLIDEVSPCRMERVGIVGREGPVRGFAATVGPLNASGARDLVALMPRDPRIAVTVAYGRAREPASAGLLWFRPQDLLPGQEPAPARLNGFVHFRIAPAEQAR